MTYNDYYVYIHRRNDTNDVFYVGKGRLYRAKSKSNRSEWWNAIVNKHGFTVEFVEKEMSEESAYDLEIEIIKFYLDNNYKLCNMSTGGQGGSTGIIRSDETKQKMREAARLTKMKPVINTDGKIFESMRAAADWCKANGYTYAKVQGISDACRLHQKTAYGYGWSFYCVDLVNAA